MEKLLERIKRDISAGLECENELSDEKVSEAIEQKAFELCEKQGGNLLNAERLIKTARDDILGFGPVQCLFEDDSITEIMINAGNVYFEKDGKILKSDMDIIDPTECMKIISTVCRKSGRTVNTAVPITDACLADGTRINIVLAPVSVNGPAVTIRKFPKTPLSGGDLVRNGFCSSAALDFLEQLYRARYNMFICGGAGTGKTTLLNVLANCTGSGERIITIEDSAELRIDKVDNIVRLEARVKNSEGAGEIKIRDLIRTSLRMRPDRIIVGEVRGGEALDMLQAMNTGHEGSISTGHANSCAELISRLETMVLMGKDIPLMAVRKQITMAIDIVICISKPGGERKITEISELSEAKNGEAVLHELFRYDYMKNKLVQTGDIIEKTKLRRLLYA
ncbi:MAG: ATPase, T2SS/T4P/T4SS family [Clostridia bacterium]